MEVMIDPGKVVGLPDNVIVLAGWVMVVVIVEAEKVMVVPGSVTVDPGRITVEPGSVTVDPGKVIVEPGSVTIDPD